MNPNRKLVEYFRAMLALGHSKESLTVIGLIRSPSDEVACNNAEVSWNNFVYERAMGARFADGYYGAEIEVAILSQNTLDEILGRKGNS